MRKIYFLSDIFIILFVLFAESFLCVFKYVSIYTGDKHNCIIKGNIIKSSSLRRVKEEENPARFRCLLFRYTGSYSQFISGCMDGSFRLLRLFHSLTQPPRFSFPFFAEHLSRFFGLFQYTAAGGNRWNSLRTCCTVEKPETRC